MVRERHKRGRRYQLGQETRRMNRRKKIGKKKKKRTCRRRRDTCTAPKDHGPEVNNIPGCILAVINCMCHCATFHLHISYLYALPARPGERNTQALHRYKKKAVKRTVQEENKNTREDKERMKHYYSQYYDERNK